MEEMSAALYGNITAERVASASVADQSKPPLSD
jgi:hypothetical protein